MQDDPSAKVSWTVQGEDEEHLWGPPKQSPQMAAADKFCTLVVLCPRTEHPPASPKPGCCSFQRGKLLQLSLFQLEMIMLLLLPRVLLGRQPRHHR